MTKSDREHRQTGRKGKMKSGCEKERNSIGNKANKLSILILKRLEKKEPKEEFILIHFCFKTPGNYYSPLSVLGSESISSIL